MRHHDAVPRAAGPKLARLDWRLEHEIRDAFEFGDFLERVQCFVVAGGDVGDSAGIFPVGVFGAYAGVIQAGTGTVDVGGLAVCVLEDVAERSVQYAGLAVGEGGGVIA